MWHMKTAQSRPASTSGTAPNGARRAQPQYGQHGQEIQPFGTVTRLPLGLDDKARQTSVELLNQILADTLTLRDLYKKCHWQACGPTFYQLHLLFDKHFQEQLELVDELAERIQTLGGISVAMPHDVIELTKVPRPPKGREEPPVQISRLLEAHEIILKETRQAARKASDAGDDGTNDLLVSDVLRTNEMQVWFLAEHLVDVPQVHAEAEGAGKSAPPPQKG
jgi:starvation-inducible DNA-binding protein